MASHRKIVLERTEETGIFTIKAGNPKKLMTNMGTLTVKSRSYGLSWEQWAYTEPSTHPDISQAIAAMEEHLDGKMLYEKTLENILPHIGQ
jgi:hypothetical protein